MAGAYAAGARTAVGGVVPQQQRARRSGEARARERVLRALDEVGVAIPQRMIHPDADEEEERRRRQYLQEIRRGQVGAEAAAAEEARDEDLPPHRILITFDQFSRVVSRLQRF